jgi:hypothetical protein
MDWMDRMDRMDRMDPEGEALHLMRGLVRLLLASSPLLLLSPSSRPA